ncbi:hypothetical protein F511_07887 [Dorcoceras hygrometricum]|uniref:MADS-box domain-containing protein n=1 Tax=Dorcoceras hygrometricum TaxID=472368 RepID=A0A2Z7ALD1_9LAMI|nr:hypothetical protein F511_07887 [Dorcoceras hygrometricum]
MWDRFIHVPLRLEACQEPLIVHATSCHQRSLPTLFEPRAYLKWYQGSLVITLIPMWDRFIHVPLRLEACQEPLIVHATSCHQRSLPTLFEPRAYLKWYQGRKVPLEEFDAHSFCLHPVTEPRSKSELVAPSSVFCRSFPRAYVVWLSRLQLVVVLMSLLSFSRRAGGLLGVQRELLVLCSVGNLFEVFATQEIRYGFSTRKRSVGLLEENRVVLMLLFSLLFWVVAAMRRVDRYHALMSLGTSRLSCYILASGTACRDEWIAIVRIEKQAQEFRERGG